MARAATTSDTFNAIAEPQRRRILTLLRERERPVGDLARELGMTQPGASKHLRVLREVGLVHVREAGRERVYASTLVGCSRSRSGSAASRSTGTRPSNG